MTDYENLKRQCLTTGPKPYVDKDFPASNTSLYFHPSWSSPFVEWKRPREIDPKAQFIVEGTKYVDLEQGELGNCWFVAGAATLAATHKELLYRVVPQDQSFDEDYAGIFRFYFWQYGQWKEVVIDDRLPTRKGQLMYCTSTNKSEFWCALLEKAYAKLYGCYEALDGGRVHDAFMDLTGGITELIDIEKNMNPETMNELLTFSQKMETLMGAGIQGSREGKLSTGLYEGHAYSIIKLQWVKYRGEKKLLLLMRNPYGKGEWNGPWSDGHATWSEVSASEKSEQATRVLDDGEFWISVEDFIANFSVLDLCHLSPDALTVEKNSRADDNGEKKKWKTIDFRDQWIKNVSSGGPLRSFTSRLFWKNPQYRLFLDENKKATSVVISLVEVTNKFVRQTGDVSIGFVIFKLKPGREQPERLTGENYYEHTPQLVDTSGVFWPYRERAKHFVLESGIYVIVPCTFLSNMAAEFYLRVFSELPMEASPVVEAVGPTRDIVPEPTDLIERLFRKYQGSDGKVDALGLQKIFTEAKGFEYDKTDGYSLETCRCLLAYTDRQILGLADLSKVKTLWNYVRTWTRVFKTTDVNNDNSVEAFELKEMFKELDFAVDSHVLQCIVRRYGGREGRIYEDDFIQSICRVLTLYTTFEKKKVDGKITLTLSEWLSSALYF